MVHHRINLLKRSENEQINISSAFLNLFENIELDVAVVDASEVDTYNVFLGIISEHNDINADTPFQNRLCWNSTVQHNQFLEGVKIVVVSVHVVTRHLDYESLLVVWDVGLIHVSLEKRAIQHQLSGKTWHVFFDVILFMRLDTNLLRGVLFA